MDEILLFDRAILPALITAWTRTEEWGEWKAVWSVGLKHGDGLVKAEISYNLTDVWKLTVGGEAPYGSGQGDSVHWMRPGACTWPFAGAGEKIRLLKTE